ncbi:ATP synthase gamma chain [uncultured Alphaproteobacteria bacterium]|uniref:ATP synthase gamma chain n=1 Tax=uncultured Alphaproteobacteria bacterium TaxID=91750 RepID=A0A212K127_9PROT|nr:ATP synthase gamma chain [uncultured Alphaproteobacteria bacterium]
MPSLKDLRLRISSVKSTKKITSAMKMVSAAKLRRAQEAAEAARPYAERMDRMMQNLSAGLDADAEAPRLMTGTGRDKTHLIVVFTSDRGLCGAFNAAVVRSVRARVRELLAIEKRVKILTVGRKGRDMLRTEFGGLIVDQRTGLGRKGVSFAEGDEVAQTLIRMFEAGEFDVCWAVYNRFQSAMTQIVTWQQVVPFAAPEDEDGEAPAAKHYDYEPSQEAILEELAPRNLSVQVFRFLLESQASEHGARMTAMDNATRNAGDMIDNLTLTYNRTRQAFITRELIEIISGAEAV